MTRRATQRQIRRAFGADAILTFENHAKAITALVTALNAFQSDVAALRERVDSLSRDVARLEEKLNPRDLTGAITADELEQRGRQVLADLEAEAQADAVIAHV